MDHDSARLNRKVTVRSCVRKGESFVFKKGKSDMLLRKGAVRLTKKGQRVLVMKGINDVGLNK
jgi:hypothetical protein